jgi:hypothetical protein
MSSDNRKFFDSYLIAHLPEKVCDNIISWGYDHIPCADLYEDPDDSSFGREKEIHVTILGPIDETSLRKITVAVNNEQPVECSLGKVKLFTTNSKYDVVMLDLESKKIVDLNRNLGQSIKNTPRFSIYVPHVTIAYVKKGLGEKYRGNKYFEGTKFLIDDLVYSHKCGHKHNLKLGKS